MIINQVWYKYLNQIENWQLSEDKSDLYLQQEFDEFMRWGYKYSSKSNNELEWDTNEEPPQEFDDKSGESSSK